MRIDDITIQRGRGFFVNLSNILSYKISNFKTEKLRINPETFNTDTIININNVSYRKNKTIKNLNFFCYILFKVDVTGDYKMNILIGLANIKGEGKFNALIGKLLLKF